MNLNYDRRSTPKSHENVTETNRMRIVIPFDSSRHDATRLDSIRFEFSIPDVHTDLKFMKVFATLVLVFIVVHGSLCFRNKYESARSLV